MKLAKGPRTFVGKVAHLSRVYRIVSWYSLFQGMELRSPRERNYRKSSNNPWRLNYIVFLKLKFDLPTKLFSKRVVWNFRFQTKSYAYPPNIRRTCWVHSYSIYLRTLALDCENSEESPCEQGEYVDDVEYETPDLSGGVEGIDYGIVYGLGDEEMEMEAEA